VKAGYEYFHQKFDVDLKQAVSVFKQAVSVFKQARFFNPAKIGELKPSCADTDDLKAIPGLRSGAMDHFPVMSHIRISLIITRWIMPGGGQAHTVKCIMFYGENPTSAHIPACKLRLEIATHGRTALFVE